MLTINNERINQKNILGNGSNGTEKYGRKDKSRRTRKIDEGGSRK